MSFASKPIIFFAVTAVDKTRKKNHNKIIKDAAGYVTKDENRNETLKRTDLQ